MNFESQSYETKEMDIFRSADGVGVDDVPPRSSGGSYDLLPIVGESASAEELETWREIRSEYESAVGN